MSWPAARRDPEMNAVAKQQLHAKTSTCMLLTAADFIADGSLEGDYAFLCAKLLCAKL